VRIHVNPRPHDDLGYSHRLWLGDHYQDLTLKDLEKLKAAVDATLSPPPKPRRKGK